jgi:hypothetical protein
MSVCHLRVMICLSSVILVVRRRRTPVAFMALIIRGNTECALCREVVASDDDIVATSHFIADPHEELTE